MSIETKESASTRLFNRYQAKFDPDCQLLPPPPTADTAETWKHLQLQLGLSSTQLSEQIAELTSLPLHKGSISPPAALYRRLPAKMLERFFLMPVAEEADEALLAVANPFNEALLEQIAFVFGARHRLVIATPEVIKESIAHAEKAQKQAGSAASQTTQVGKYTAGTEDAAVPKLATELLKRAVNGKASDLHLQPFPGGALVRIRVDGALQRLVLLPESVGRAVIRFFKAQAGMDPTHDLVPQDGRMDIQIAGNAFDLRISTLPVAGHQEKLVIRFLNRQSLFKLSAMGFSLDEIHTLERMAASPSGVILVCGPTGCGKTTTLYSILSDLNKEETSIMTVENPVEYQMAGLSQTEINAKAGMTFPIALRAILRQDPDVLLIGEIRDDETAQIAMQAALTGHLVFSTLHTNDSLSAIPRLLDLGIKPIILAEALTGIMSQRLLRKLCQHCKAPCDTQADPFAKAFLQATRSLQAARAVGCEHCHQTGYAGRTVVAEMLEITPAQRDMLLGGETDLAKFKAALRGNFNTLSISASRLIMSGITTAAEASGILGQQFWIELAHEYQGELPDVSSLSAAGSSKSKAGVLIAGKAPDDLEQHLRDAWLDVFFADAPAPMEVVLREHESIRMIVINIDDSVSSQEIVSLVAEYRKHMAWSRLPALIRVPAAHPEYIQLLQDNGATSRIITSDTRLLDVLETIQEALNLNLDFKWGLRPTEV